ncbi:MAG: hypothetical protein GXO43_02275 [Crenarchaeota archaeon]|nr:hypothetical protein [Thermoproteota archaeon]
MVKAKVEESGGLPLIEEGVYPAWLKGVEEREIEVKGEKRKIFSWRFIVDVDGKKVELEGISSAKVTTKSKAYRWASAIMGRKPKVGEIIDFDELVGLPCTVIVENKPVKNGDGEFSRVQDVTVAPKGMRKLTEDELVADEEEEEEEEIAEVEEEEEEVEPEEIEVPKPKKKKKKIKIK